jgi:DGQHR domain-containing protein
MEFKPQLRRRRPERHFYVFSLGAAELKALSGIRRRTVEHGTPRAADPGIQRQHDPKRSSEIARFVLNGYPWSSLTKAQRETRRFDDLRKPGWLPTSVVVNILTPEDERANGAVAREDLVEIENPSSSTPTIVLPVGLGPEWEARNSDPIEVIDGQHRLWAFEPDRVEEYELPAQGYQLPVVAFFGLDVSWQAYLFWTINIKPVRINPSLAFDLYPLLRSEDWLERFEGPVVYRQTRAQELTEALWSLPESPWYQRINMLGERGVGGVTQNAWVRALTSTFVRRADPGRKRTGGLFGAPAGSDRLMLPWNRAQQAAFLIYLWQCIEEAVRDTTHDWARFLRQATPQDPAISGKDPALAGPNTYLNTDQGVRALLAVTNDLCFNEADELRLAEWLPLESDAPTDDDSIRVELARLREEAVADFLRQLAAALSSFDWRASSAPGLSDDQRALKLAFRGSGGYVEFRRQLLGHLARADKENVGQAAKRLVLLDSSAG